jgi:hypothetical protein
MDPDHVTMTSREKVIAALARLDDIDTTQLEPQAMTMVLTLTMARPKIASALPVDPAELDRLLLTGALWALGLRSDDADAAQLTIGDQTIDLAAPALGEAA